jgi:hypothetical protein
MYVCMFVCMYVCMCAIVSDDGSFISVLPAFLDVEFMCPALITEVC